MTLIPDKTCAMTYLCGPKDVDRRIRSNPTWADIENAIRGLNGKDGTLVSFGSGIPVPHMAIGGGEEGRYILYATHDNVTFYTLIGNDRSGGKIQFVAGGQLGEYRLRNCVNLEQALAAARVFAEECRVDGSLEWDVR